ncbi:MAG TPA: translocation/assembly module TamB domain-containing protein [Planctomycetota bacterium]|nr:translocation/assembly module TamB domain-containing protein [Planctomycetota bacterium]
MSAHAAETIPRERGRVTRWALRLGAAFLVLLAAALVLYLLRARLIAPYLLSRVAEETRKATGLELTVERVGGNWWNELDLAGVRLAGPSPRTELTSVAVGRVRAHYDLRQLLRGDVRGLAEIELDAASVVLDVDRPRPANTTPPDAAPAPFPWPAVVPRIVVRDSEIALGVGGGGWLEARGVDVTTAGADADGRAVLDVRARSAGFRDPHFGERAAEMTASVEYRAGVFEIPSVAFAGETLARELRCDLRDVAAAIVTFEGIVDRYGGAQEVRGAIGERQIELAFDLHDVELAPLLADLRVRASCAGRASVGGLLRVPFAAPAMWSARAWGTVDDFALGNRRVDFAAFTAGFDAEHVDVPEGLFVLGANELRLASFGCSLEVLELEDILRSFTGSADLDVLDPRALLGGAPADVLAAAGRVSGARLAVNFRPRGLDVRSGVLDTELGGLVLQRGRATWGPRELPLYQGLSIDVDAALAFDDIAPVAALFKKGDASGALKGIVELRGPALRPSGSFVLDGEGLRVAGYDVGRVSVAASADQDKLEITKLLIEGGLGTASVSGGVDYVTGRISGGKISARTAALAKLSAGRASAAEATIEAAVEGTFSSPQVHALVHARELAAFGRSVKEVEFEGTYVDECVHVERLVGDVDEVDVDAAGSVCRDKASGTWRVALERARLARGELELSLEKKLEVALSPEKLVIQELRVAGTAGRAAVDLSWTADEQRISIDASELYPMALLKPFLPSGVEIEGVQGTLTLHRMGDVLEADAALSVASLRPSAESPPAALSFRGSFADKTLVIAQFTLASPEHYELDVSGRLPTDPLARDWLSAGPLELFGSAHVSDLSSLPWRAWGVTSTWSGDVRAEFRLEGDSTDVRGVVDAKLDVVRGELDSLLDRARLNAFQFDGRVTLGEEVRLDNARFAVPGRASAILDGRLGLHLSPREWLRAKTLDWRALPADLRAVVTAKDLGFVAGLSPALLRRTGGSIEGELLIKGTLGNPSATGALDLTQGEVRLSNALAAFEDLSAHLEFEGTSVRLLSLRGDYGAAPFEAAGMVDFGHHEPVLDITLGGKGLLLAREAGLRLRADADLHIEGPLSALKITGGVMLVDGRFSREFQLLSLPGSSRTRSTRELELPFLREEPWASMEFDVSVTARKPLRVDTNVARGTVDPSLKLEGSGAAPRLGGTVLIGSTRVKLPAATLEVVSGVLTFRGESRLAPSLDITAVTRVRGYDVTARISGNSLDPEVLFTSSPPLASEELAVLVLTGQFPESALSATGGEAAAQTVVVYLGRDLLTRWLGVEGDSEDPISERLEFYRGAEVGRTGIESTEFIFRLTPNPKGKSTILYLRAEKDIYERVNYGVKFLFRFR